MQKFKTGVSMVITQKQYEQDFKQPLKDLGYVIYRENHPNIYFLLVTRDITEHNRCCFYNKESCSKTLDGRYFINNYNPELFLALAAMTEGEVPVQGEFMVFLPERNESLTTNIWHKDLPLLAFKEFSDNNTYIFYDQPESNCRTMFRKATKEELIKHFASSSIIEKQTEIKPSVDSIMNLKKGDYVVFTEIIRATDTFKLNHIFKLREAINLDTNNGVLPEIDCAGSETNGWQIKLFRVATKNEGLMYEDAGKPVDVTTYEMETPITKSLNFHVKYTEEFTEDLFNALEVWIKSNFKYKRNSFYGPGKTYDIFKKYKYYFLKGIAGVYGLSNHDWYVKAVTIEQVKAIIGYVEPKPFEFIKDKWYQYNSAVFVKYESSLEDGNYIIASERIVDSIYYKAKVHYRAESLTSIPIKQIQCYLPDDHIDKIGIDTEFIMNNWYVCTSVNRKYYIKLQTYNKERVTGESIYPSESYHPSDSWSNKSMIADLKPLTNLFEIQEQLPDGHRDKVSNIIPDNWYVVVTKDNQQEVKDWWNTGFTPGLGSKYGMLNGDKEGLSSSAERSWTEISTAQFRFKILNPINYPRRSAEVLNPFPVKKLIARQKELKKPSNNVQKIKMTELTVKKRSSRIRIQL